MNIKKMASIFLVSSSLLGVGIIAPNLTHVNAQNTQTSQNNDQGVITVNYVDQNGKTIRQSTTATGKSGSTYVASVPNISGYTYSKIENGQNDSYGPQMVFGGSDPATHNESMTIVYKSSGNSSNGSTSTTGNKGTATTPAKNGSSNNSNKNTTSNSTSGTNKDNNSNNSKSGTNKNATNGTNKNSSSTKTNEVTANSDAKNVTKNNNENKANVSASNTNKSNDKQDKNLDSNVDKKNKTNNKKDKNKDKNDDKNSDSTKKKDQKKTHHSVIPWIVSGIIIVAIAGIAFAWHELRKPRHFRH